MKKQISTIRYETHYQVDYNHQQTNPQPLHHKPSHKLIHHPHVPHTPTNPTPPLETNTQPPIQAIFSVKNPLSMPSPPPTQPHSPKPTTTTIRVLDFIHIPYRFSSPENTIKPVQPPQQSPPPSPKITFMSFPTKILEGRASSFQSNSSITFQHILTIPRIPLLTSPLFTIHERFHIHISPVSSRFLTKTPEEKAFSSRSKSSITSQHVPIIPIFQSQASSLLIIHERLHIQTSPFSSHFPIKIPEERASSSWSKSSTISQHVLIIPHISISTFSSTHHLLHERFHIHT